jgi:hypothetical protein
MATKDEEAKMMARIKAAKDQTAEAERKLALTQDEIGKQKRAMRKTQADKERIAASEEQTLALVRPQANVIRQVGVNLGSTVAAQGLNELINLGVRFLAEWGEESKKKEGKDPLDSFWYANVDLFQSTGGAVGLILWIVELLTRPKYAEKDGKVLTDSKGQPIPYVPSWARQFVNELASILQNLGYSNLFRSLRFRFREDVDEREETQAAIAAKDAEIAALRKQLGQ